jgi:predicted HD phosphohydrolase
MRADTNEGGIFNSEQVEAAQRDPWLEQKLAVRRWDDMAKVPNMKVNPLSFYEDIAIQSLIGASQPRDPDN